VLISLGEIVVITLVALVALKPCDIAPIAKSLRKVVNKIKMKISTIISYIKQYL